MSGVGLYCDVCGLRYDDNAFGPRGASFSNQDELKRRAAADGWLVADDRHECPKCRQGGQEGGKG